MAEGKTTDKPVERFKPTSGTIPGVAGLLFVAVAVGYVATSVHTITGLRVASAMVVFGVLVWITQLRPRATAYPETLVLRNVLRDTLIPLRLVDEVLVRQTMHVWVGDEKYVCLGIGRSVRNLIGHKRPMARILGTGVMHDMADDVPHPDQTAMSYVSFVETRLDDLANYARKAPVTDPDATVRHRWAWPELVVLVAAGLTFLVSLFLG